jgi:outer membrane protein OmpA-like peptidoglycan-associated protein
MAGFCPNCGKPVADAAVFCGSCGAKLSAAPAPAVPAATSPVAGMPPASAPSLAIPAAQPPIPVPANAPAAKSGGCGKVVVIIVVILVLMMIAGFAGFAYLAYRAKKKVDEVHDAYKNGDLNKIAGALGGKEVDGGKDIEAMPNYPEYSSGSAASSAVEAAKSAESGATAGDESSLGSVVPMKAGLRITTAIQQSLGDYESLKAIKSVSPAGVLMEYSADVPEMTNPLGGDDENKSEQPKTRSVRSSRRILREDLQSSHEYAESFSENLPEVIQGTTALGVSASVLNDLKTKGEADFTYQATGLKGALGGLLGGLGLPGGTDNLPVPKDKETQDAMKQVKGLSKESCRLKRTDQKIYSFPVLVNGVRTQLPAIKASCKSDDELAEFYFLDDPQNPLSLTWKLGSSDRLQVIKIEYVQQAAVTANSSASKELEQKLEKKEKVEIYGIYFDFASAKIKPESKPTLDEIASVMKAHPDWKLNVDGHTDNVGTDPGNLELSKQRAAAVKDALANDYHIGAERLDTNGYGASRPVETNATMEGRARNRRVELSRQ